MMNCVIMYKQGNFYFKYDDVRFCVRADVQLQQLFDVLGGLIVIKRLKERFGEDEGTRELKVELWQELKKIIK